MLLLSQLRKNIGLTQEEASNKLGIKQNTLSQYENGKRKPGYKTLIDMSNLYNKSLEELINYIENLNKEKL